MNKINNVYLLFGDEKYDLQRKVTQIKKEFDNLELGVNFFNITNENVEQLKEIIQEVTFFGSHKLIIIKNTNLKFDIEILYNIDEDIIVIIIEDSIDKRTTNYKKIAKIADIEEFKTLDRKTMTTYVYDLMKRYKLSPTFDVADYFVEVCGLDKNNNINEMKKIVIFMESQGIVTKDIINKVCSKTLNAKIFDVLNQIIEKNHTKALMMLDDILKQKESIIKIYIMLYKQIKQMYMIKYLKSKKETNISSILGIHPYTFKLLEISSGKYSTSELKHIINMFGDYDEKVKNGDLDFEIGLKKIICLI